MVHGGMHSVVRSRAFSLVELVMVIGIISVIAAIAIPAYARSLQRYAIDAAAQRIVSDLAFAQNLANSTSSTQAVSFAPASATYQVAGMPDPDHLLSAYTVNLAATYSGVALQSANFAGLTQISFDGYGVPKQGGTVVLVLGDLQRTITVDISTGKATVQ